jgi:soluble lytic murein transglycosylase-like protein
MAKNYDKLINMNKEKIYRKYLWMNDKKEWLKLILNKLFKTFRPVLFILLMILPTIFVIDTLADGTNNKYYLSLQVQRLQSVLPQLEKAYNDVDKLSNSISKVAYKDLDVTFIYAFMIVKWAAANKLDPMEVAGIIQTESQFNPKAVSKANARGLMQVHKPSWKMDDYFDVEENIKKGAQILWMYKKSNPGNYLDLYSGGAENYEAKVRNNTQKIKKSIIPVKTGG